jgi:hypothetical protein
MKILSSPGIYSWAIGSLHLSSGFNPRTSIDSSIIDYLLWLMNQNPGQL